MSHAKETGGPLFLDTRAIWSLSLAEQFDARMDHTEDGYNAHPRSYCMSRVRGALAIARSKQVIGDPIDIFLDMETSSLTCVPNWNRDQITELAMLRFRNAFAYEELVLNEEASMLERFGTELAKASERASCGYGQGERGRYSI